MDLVQLLHLRGRSNGTTLYCKDHSEVESFLVPVLGSLAL